MKNLALFFTLVVVVLFAACSEKKEKKEEGEPSLKLKTTVMEETILCPGGDEEENKMIYTINLTYPSEFGDPKVLEKLQQHFVQHAFGEELSGRSVDNVIELIAEGWKTDYLDNCMDRFWNLGVYDSIVYVSDELLQYYVCAYETNGANNSGMLTYHLLSLQTGNEYTQEDIFKPESANDIRQLIVAQIQSQQSVDPDWDMELAWTPETSFVITDKGVLIEYNVYDLGIRETPDEAILLPYKELLPYLKDGTPVHTLATK